MAKLHHYHDLAVNALQFLLVNFSKIVEKEELTSLPFEVVSDIVSSKLLDVSSEEKLYEVTFIVVHVKLLVMLKEKEK